MSIRARQVVDQRSRARAAARQAALEQATARAEQLHARWLSRSRAAEHLGLSLHQLRRAMTAGTSPAYAKPRGDHKQAPPVFLLEHLDEWLRDRDRHLAERAQRMTQAAALAAAELSIS